MVNLIQFQTMGACESSAINTMLETVCSCKRFGEATSMAKLDGPVMPSASAIKQAHYKAEPTLSSLQAEARRLEILQQNVQNLRCSRMHKVHDSLKYRATFRSNCVQTAFGVH